MAKLLLCCGKAKPLLAKMEYSKTHGIEGDIEWYEEYGITKIKEEIKLFGTSEILNGKIVAECDFEDGEIKYEETSEECWYVYNSDYSNHNWEKETGLLIEEIDKYLNGKNGHAINIKNLHIFDKPKELSEYYTRINDKDRMNDFKGIDVIFPDVQIDEWLYECVSCKKLEKAPRNIQKIVLLNKETNKYEYAILISIKSEELCRILNGNQTIIVRKKVLKEML